VSLQVLFQNRFGFGLFEDENERKFGDVSRSEQCHIRLQSLDAVEEGREAAYDLAPLNCFLCDAHLIEDFQGARVDGECARLSGVVDGLVENAKLDTVHCELAGEQKTGGASSCNNDVDDLRW